MRSGWFNTGAIHTLAARSAARMCLIVSCTFAAGLLSVSPTSAHHSFAAYDQAVTKAVSGTLKEFDWNAPHSGVTVVYANEKGEPSEVSVTTGAPNTIARQGFTPKDFKVGLKVEMSWHPNRNGLLGGELVQLKLPDGRVLQGGFAAPPGADKGTGAPGGGPPPAAAASPKG